MFRVTLCLAPLVIPAECRESDCSISSCADSQLSNSAYAGQSSQAEATRGANPLLLSEVIAPRDSDMPGDETALCKPGGFTQIVQVDKTSDLVSSLITVVIGHCIVKWLTN